jgi:hypothetical protein
MATSDAVFQAFQILYFKCFIWIIKSGSMMFHMLQRQYTHVFPMFKVFQLFQMHVSSVFICFAYVAMAAHACFKCLFSCVSDISDLYCKSDLNIVYAAIAIHTYFIYFSSMLQMFQK